MATRKFSPAQIAAQKLFAERARAGTLKQRKKRKPNPGLYENIDAKRKRIAAGSGEKMRKPGQAGRPTAKAFEQSAMTAKRNPEGRSIFNLGGKYFGSVTMSGYNEYYAEVFYRTTDSSGSIDDQIVPDYKPRYFVNAKSAVNSLMRYKTKNLGRKTNPDKTKPRANPKVKKPKKYYQVSIMQEGLHTKFMGLANFFTFSEAENYANHLAKQHKNWTIRVHDIRAM